MSKSRDILISVGLRLNISLSRSDGTSPRQGGHQYSRFGFRWEDGTLRRVVETLREEPNVKIVGLHGHASTTTRDAFVYSSITTALCRAGETLLGDDLEYINVGGGFFSRLPKEYARPDIPTFEDYAEIICPIVIKHFGLCGPQLYLEPGTAVVADCFAYVSKVLDVYSVAGQQYVLIDGSAIHAKPTMHAKSLPVELWSLPGDIGKERGDYSIVGFTCMEKDVIADSVDQPIPQPGDFIVAKNVGAYTITMVPQFIEVRPPIVAISKDNDMHVVRRRDVLSDVFGSYE
jgi:diaminopimelate decarboxylase